MVARQQPAKPVTVCVLAMPAQIAPCSSPASSAAASELNFVRSRLSFSAKDARRARAESLPYSPESDGDHDEIEELEHPEPKTAPLDLNITPKKSHAPSTSPVPKSPSPSSPILQTRISHHPNPSTPTLNSSPKSAPSPSRERAVPDNSSPSRHQDNIDNDAVSALEGAGYAVISELSDGSFGAVYRATRMRDGLDVAAKAVRRDRLSPEELAAVRSQSATLSSLHHRHLVSLVEAFDHPNYIFHVFEFLHGGDLFDRLEARGRPFEERDALELAAQMLRAVGYLHARRAAHRDIKLENFVFATVASAQTPVLKLIDFDLLLVRGRDAPPGATCTDMCGTVLYVPPELAAAREYVPEEADMWALGVVLFVLLCFEMPFQGRAPRDILREVRNAAPSFAGPAWRKISRRSRELVEMLLSKSGAARPSAEEALTRVESIMAMPSTVHPRNMSISLRYLGARLLTRRRARKRNHNEDLTLLSETSMRAMQQERASQDELDGLICYDRFQQETYGSASMGPASLTAAAAMQMYDRDGVGAEKLEALRRMESEDTMLALQKMRQQDLTKSIPMGKVLGGMSSTRGAAARSGALNKPKRGVSESALRRYWTPKRKLGRHRQPDAAIGYT